VSLGSTEVINVTDTTYASGYLGLNAFNGTAGFQNVNISAATNVALNKPATGSAACNSNEIPAKAFNGSWTGGNSDKFCSLATTQFLQVDLGQSYSVSSVVVRHAGAGGESTSWNTRDFDIQLSSGGSSWTTVAQVRGNTASTTTHPISATGRYARLNIITPTQDGNAATRIYEFEVYGTPAPAPRCEGANDTNYTINDNSTVESPITISGCDGNPGSSSTVEVHIVHTYIGDLIVTLVAPDGRTYTLHDRSGGSADNINQTYTVNLSSEAANGAWKLRVQDAASLDTGYIDSWTLTL
jgi:Proprotein convertase P-domain/F5/8 type C domain